LHYVTEAYVEATIPDLISSPPSLGGRISHYCEYDAGILAERTCADGWTIDTPSSVYFYYCMRRVYDDIVDTSTVCPSGYEGRLMSPGSVQCTKDGLTEDMACRVFDARAFYINADGENARLGDVPVNGIVICYDFGS
jgi:hypothetical protein